MLLGVILALVFISGIVFGFIKRTKSLAITSIVFLIIEIIVWIFFYSNPY